MIDTVRVCDPRWRSAASAVSLVRIPRAALDAIAAGDDAAAVRLADVPLTPYLLGVPCRRIWQIRSEQLATTPADHDWVTRVILDDASGTAIGLAGFHGAPDERGMVELGYRVDPAVRRRGHARAALRLMLQVAAGDWRVDVVRATVSPDNLASRALIDQHGFREVGEQWDEEDGLETILERPAGH